VKLNSPLRGFIIAVVFCLIVVALGLVAIRLIFDRTREFEDQAQIGQPIVKAIELFRIQSGRCPETLSELVPQYLPIEPSVFNRKHYQSGSWEYKTFTNENAVSYKLRCYMGRGGVEYVPPNWIGIDEGHSKILFQNK
jgi:hypothetical protein